MSLWPAKSSVRFKVEKLVASGISRGWLPPVLYPTLSRRVLGCEYFPEQSLFRKSVGPSRSWVARLPSIFYDRGLETICRDLYFKHYLPRAGETYVNIGASYGQEAVWLLDAVGAELRAILVEPQPSVFEALCLGLGGCPGVTCINAAVAEERVYVDAFAESSAAATASSQQRANLIPVPNITALELQPLLSGSVIDLCQVNTEGAEAWIIPHLLASGLTVKRFLVSCHDFRAELGHGEHFRTKERVLPLLREAGYELSFWKTGVDYLDDWVFADRSAV